MRDRLEFPELGLGSVEIIQRHHRYAVVWPSVHPKTGQPYVWRHTGAPDRMPLADELPELNPAWIEALTVERVEVAAIGSAMVRQFLESFEPGTPCKAVENRLRVLYGHAAGTNRHDDVREDVLSLLRLGEQGHRGVHVALQLAREKFSHAVGPDRAGGVDEADREFDRFMTGQRGVAMILRDPTPRSDRGCCGGQDVDLRPIAGGSVSLARVDDEDADGDLRAETGADGMPVTALSPYLLPDEVWKFSDELGHIYRAAMARLVSPDALLHAVLATLASLLHHESRVETGKGPSVLSYFFAAVGASGAGKSESLKVGRELLREWTADRFAITGADGYVDRQLGTGEGLIASFIGDRLVKVLDPDTGEPVLDGKGHEKVTKEQAQIRHNALFHTDEGRQALSIDSRKGSTLMSVLCELWSGSAAGQTNADKERNRQIAAGSYVVGVMVGFQITTVDTLFSDEAGGAPQRFVWASAEYAPHGENLDEDEDAPWPGELHPAVPAGPITVTLGEEQRREVRRNIRAKAAGLADEGPLDGHRMLLRCRMAALLALLHGQTEVSAELWELARVILDRSCELRDWLAGRVEREARRLAAQKEASAIRTAVKAENAVEEMKRIRRGADAIVRAVEKAGGELSEGRALHALRSTARDVKVQALAHALASGAIVREQRASTAKTGPREVVVLRLATSSESED